MKKILSLFTVFLFVFCIFSFVSADPIIHGPIDGVTEIDIPMEEAPELCVEADYTYTNWGDCQSNHKQTRTVTKINTRCEGGFIPESERTCHYIDAIEFPIPIEEVPELCVEADYIYTNWGDCQSNNTRTRGYTKINTRCDGGFVPQSSNLTQSCTYSIPGGNTGGGGTVFLPQVSNPIQQVLGEKIAEDRWIKTPDNSTIYLLDANNIRHSYPTEKVWYSYFAKDFSFVETISNEELSGYALGKNVQFKKGSLIKTPSVPKVYLVGDNFLIQWIKTEETAIRLYGADWNKLVYDFPESFFSDYVLGDDIE